MKLEFVKVQGLGNDFILFDQRERHVPFAKEQIAKWCHRKMGIGADGVIVLKPSNIATCRMEFFNADGSRAAMCGNALRCIALVLGIPKITVETEEGIFPCVQKEGKIAVEFPVPQVMHWPLDTQQGPLYVVKAGVPHGVAFVQGVGIVPVVTMGRALRFHPALQPEGANIHFVRVTSQKEVEMCSYERGVEGETLACGSGAIAVAWIVSKVCEVSFPIHVKMRGGSLIVHLLEGKGTLEMIGPAEHVFSGTSSAIGLMHDEERGSAAHRSNSFF